MRIIRLEDKSVQYSAKLSRIKNPKTGYHYIIYVPRSWGEGKFGKRVKVTIELEEDN